MLAFLFLIVNQDEKKVIFITTTQLTFFIDINKCIDCKSCEMACNKFYDLKGVHRRNVVSYGKDSLGKTIHVSISCNHCKNPVCIYICPENNFQKRQDGIVVLNAINCKGCERCINACPFHAPKLNPVTNRADKCNFCSERIDQGLKPICVDNCSTGALKMSRLKNNVSTLNAANHEDEIPLSGYTNPSIFITRKQQGHTYFR